MRNASPRIWHLLNRANVKTIVLAHHSYLVGNAACFEEQSKALFCRPCSGNVTYVRYVG
jgi:hypothetical protein